MHTEHGYSETTPISGTPYCVHVRPRLHDTTGCQNGFTTGWTTVVYRVYERSTGCPTGCSTGLTAGCIV